jgi:hypothetical protein
VLGAENEDDDEEDEEAEDDEDEEDVGEDGGGGDALLTSHSNSMLRCLRFGSTKHSNCKLSSSQNAS